MMAAHIIEMCSHKHAMVKQQKNEEEDEFLSFFVESNESLRRRLQPHFPEHKFICRLQEK